MKYLTYSMIVFFTLLMNITINGSQLDKEYSKEFTDIIELVYGSDFLSQGGSESVDCMFAGLNLNGKKLLDIGSGLGGVDFYLARKYKTDITGIDCVMRLVETANIRKVDHELNGTVVFLHQEINNFSYSFPNDTFDIVFSKESLLHVADKFSLLTELFRVLKPGGQLIILDWLRDAYELGPHIKEMMAIDGLDLKMATLQEYTAYLHNAGFNNIFSLCMNEQYIHYTHQNIEKIKSEKGTLLKLLGEVSYNYSLKTWNIQKKIFEYNEVLVTLLKAIKPE